MIINWGSNNHNSEQNETKDYSKFSNDQLLDSFKSDNWSQMKENDRVGVIQELENRTAAEQGREPAVVVSSSRVTSYGSYNSTTNQMNINVSNFSHMKRWTLLLMKVTTHIRRIVLIMELDMMSTLEI